MQLRFAFVRHRLNGLQHSFMVNLSQFDFLSCLTAPGAVLPRGCVVPFTLVVSSLRHHGFQQLLGALVSLLKIRPWTFGHFISLSLLLLGRFATFSGLLLLSAWGGRQQGRRMTTYTCSRYLDSSAIYFHIDWFNLLIAFCCIHFNID